jgi:hypothetical protein
MNASKSLTKTVTNYSDPNSIGSKFRSRRIVPLIKMIEQAYEVHGKVDIIDIGGRKTYWRILPICILSKYKVMITIVNLPDASEQGGDEQERDEEHFCFRFGDGCNLSCFPDNNFQIVHANSVIEHVGDWFNMLKFAKEVRRLAPQFFIQTPYFWFPIEPHFMMLFFHWLPRPTRIWLLLHFDLGNHPRSLSVHEAAGKLENYRLLDRQMFTALFPDAQIISEKFLGLTKSLIAVRS